MKVITITALFFALVGVFTTESTPAPSDNLINLPAGAFCSDSSECGNKANCHMLEVSMKGICVKDNYIPLNGRCTKSGQCKNGGTCIVHYANYGFCLKEKSVPIGSPCTSSKQCKRPFLARYPPICTHFMQPYGWCSRGIESTAE
jgi:hypothetical protein